MPDQTSQPGALVAAGIDWQADGAPLSTTYGDVYFSRGDGLEESRHVFLRHNGLPARWESPAAAGSDFVIMETGFGTGLNFLATWQAWRASGPRPARLHFVSIEKHPLSAQDLARSLAAFAALRTLSQALIDQYPPALPGIHALDFGPEVALTLAFGDAAAMLAALCDCDHPRLRAALAVKADAWYLDGFAPARNPDMWSLPVIDGIAALSKPGTSFATFTAAGAVRRALEAAGFAVNKVPGFGRKRDMLCGQLGTSVHPPLAPPPAPRRRARSPQAWHAGAGAHRGERTALIIGAGLAGCHSAAALAARGWRVTVLERDAEVAAEASGNAAGILYARLSASDSPLSRFNLHAYLHASRCYRQGFSSGKLLEGRDGALSGMLQLGFDEAERQHLAAVAARYAGCDDLVSLVPASEASALSGVAIDYPALYFPGSGWLAPRRWCRHLLQHPGITVRTDCGVLELERSGQLWRAHSGRGSDSAAVCIVAGGLGCRRLAPLAFLPLRPLGGQVTLLPAPGPLPRVALCHAGYVTALGGDTLSCGASFRVNDDSTQLRDDDHRYNLAQLSTHLPSLLDPAQLRQLDPAALQGRAGVRCTTPDYLPIVGPVPDVDALCSDFAPLARDARADIPRGGSFVPGLYVNTGHGSRGLTTTPIAAALLAALLHGTPRPLDWPLVRALSPARFPIRELARGGRSHA